LTVLSHVAAVTFQELVKPDSPVLDYRTELTGLKAADLEDVQTDRQTVAARIKALLTPGTVLVGHSLHYDLGALLLDHQPVIDTAMIFSYQ
jgi:RNA exonuclease 1